MATVDEFRNQIFAKAAQDSEFRTRLKEDPVATIGDEVDLEIPEELKIIVHEDSGSVVNLVLPPSVELDEGELDQISAGMEGPYPTW